MWLLQVDTTVVTLTSFVTSKGLSGMNEHTHTHAVRVEGEMRDVGLVRQLRYSTRALGSFRGFPPRESDTLSDLL